VPYLSSVGRHKLQTALANCRKIIHFKGQVVCKQGAPVEYVYFVGKGEYELSIKAPEPTKKPTYSLDRQPAID